MSAMTPQRIITPADKAGAPCRAKQEGASEYIGDRLEQYGLEQAIEASQADENAHDQPTSVDIT
jgi:hypothetical protein